MKSYCFRMDEKKEHKKVKCDFLHLFENSSKAPLRVLNSQMEIQFLEYSPSHYELSHIQSTLYVYMYVLRWSI